ncbi:MAG: SNF2-related protein [Candidatus Cloacimonadota bacterium]|nr:SNF2-related protein [Candidatus Cloacimonadota bacterium]
MYEINEQYFVFSDSSLTSESSVGLLFQELLENGLAHKEDNEIFIPHEEICRMSSIDQKILNLPDFYPFDIRIDSAGMLQNSDFKLVLKYYEYNHGSQLFGNRTGCILTLQNRAEYLLPLKQYQLCGAVDEFNNLDERDFPTNLTKFAGIKQLSEDSAAILDSYLKNEQIFLPEKISLKLKKNDAGDLEILPEVEEQENSNIQTQFEQKFDDASKVRQSYTIKDENNKRIRIPFNKDQQNELKKIKENRIVSGKKKEKILESPHELFDPEIINLDNFSDRVIKIGLYKPKYFPFISPYKSEWIPGIIIDSGQEKRKILIPDNDELENLEKACNKAESDEGETIDFRGEQIPVEEAKKLINLARKQLKNLKIPVKQITEPDNGKIVKQPPVKKKVLIIEDNLYEDKYQKYEKLPVPCPDTFIHKFKNPPSLKDEIKFYDHQKEGIAWMESLFDDSYPGGLLADDMGLGKTIQILSFIDWHNSTQNKEQKPYLIVAPITLLENWHAEIRKFFNIGIDINILHSSDRDQINLSNLKRHSIFLTNYETIRKSKNQLVFGQVNWAVICIDEAQKIKTPGTLVTNAIKALKADFKIAATGTPVENSMVDLWCIVDFVVPGLLGSAKDFSRQYQKPVKRNISDDKLNELGEKLRSQIGLYFKRRLKKEILLGLPEKTEKKKTNIMPDYQKATYFSIIEEEQADNTRGILSTILDLKKVSDHPYLIGYNYENISSEKLIETSAKLTTTIEILEEIKRKKEKVIVFAEFKKTQRILKKVIQEHFDLKSVSIINGEMAARKGKRSQKETRQGAIDRFQREAGFNIIIMSPVAAGLGLNVTGANHVIHYSRHWNPSKESQATDRAYRIGQEKEVVIYYPMAVLDECKTFDVVIDDLLKQKRNLADAAMFPSAICEIKAEDFADNLYLANKQTYTEESLSLKDLDQLDPMFFEAAIGTIFEKKGCEIILTPKSNDKGADVIARSNSRNYLIQVKQSKYPINDNAIGEVLKAKGYYESLYNEEFYPTVATNSTLNENASMLANDNDVAIYDQSSIKKFLENKKIFLSEISSIEKKRKDKI